MSEGFSGFLGLDPANKACRGNTLDQLDFIVDPDFEISIVAGRPMV